MKYRFRIRTRQGLVIDKLSIQGRDAAHAESKLRQMYPDCEILDGLSRAATTIPRMLALRGEPSVAPGK